MAEKKCKHCAMMIPEEAKICPHCRKKQGMSGGKIVLLIIGLFFLIVIFANIAGKEEPARKSVTPAVKSEPVNIEPVLELQTWSWSEEHGYAIAEGVIKNISAESIDNIVAFMQTYDENGNFIKADRALIDYRPLLPGQTSPFKVMSSFNPAMKKASLDFKKFSGGNLLWRKKEGGK